MINYPFYSFQVFKVLMHVMPSPFKFAASIMNDMVNGEVHSKINFLHNECI
jgi:hypothetical protein